jgi:hypothetical protein
MHRRKKISGGKNEQGVVITLVAVFMLFVVGAMAALSIDVVTIYTARSEAQLAADGAALAGARVLANSGMTSDLNAVSDGLMSNAQTLASAVATQVAGQNNVGGAVPTSINVSFGGNPPTNPTVTVRVQNTNLPTFFARIWGTTQLTVGASATAEAYNPSGAGTGQVPVAPICVKPWLLPNMDPSNGNNPIFATANGAINSGSNLLGWQNSGATRLRTDCTACTANSAPTAWRYYPGTTDAAGDFPPPAGSSCTGCGAFTNYQLSIAGCVQTPVSCSSPVASPVHVDTTNYPTRDTETGTAVTGLTHATANAGDRVDTAVASPPSGNEPFQFLAGGDNPVVQSGALASGADVMVSDSLVTVPVINVDSGTPVPLPGFPEFQIIGFVQLFLSPTGLAAPGSGHIHTQVINLAGCGTGATGTPILGNGASPVAVRLISPP